MHGIHPTLLALVTALFSIHGQTNFGVDCAVLKERVAIVKGKPSSKPNAKEGSSNGNSGGVKNSPEQHLWYDKEAGVTRDLNGLERIKNRNFDLYFSQNLHSRPEVGPVWVTLPEKITPEMTLKKTPGTPQGLTIVPEISFVGQAQLSKIIASSQKPLKLDKAPLSSLKLKQFEPIPIGKTHWDTINKLMSQVQAKLGPKYLKRRDEDGGDSIRLSPSSDSREESKAFLAMADRKDLLVENPETQESLQQIWFHLTGKRIKNITLSWPKSNSKDISITIT